MSQVIKKEKEDMGRLTELHKSRGIKSSNCTATESHTN